MTHTVYSTLPSKDMKAIDVRQTANAAITKTTKPSGCHRANLERSASFAIHLAGSYWKRMRPRGSSWRWQKVFILVGEYLSMDSARRRDA